MSRKFKKHYDNFSRVILAEFMKPEELNELDKKYTQAKFARLQRKIEEDLKSAK